MTEKKIELEKRINSVQSDRDGVSAALEEATDRIMMLERQTREQEIQVRPYFEENFFFQNLQPIRKYTRLFSCIIR